MKKEKFEKELKQEIYDYWNNDDSQMIMGDMMNILKIVENKCKLLRK